MSAAGAFYAHSVLKRLKKTRSTRIMGHHINAKGQFQSDKYPDLPPDKIVLSFKDPAARYALTHFALETSDAELSDDVEERLHTITQLNGSS